MLYMSLGSHWTGRRQVFECLYHGRGLECVAPQQAVEVGVVDMTAFLARRLSAQERSHAFLHSISQRSQQLTWSLP